MSHVDEGLLHAYLDGAFPKGNAQGEDIEAHLAVCVDCRVRLEDARALKEHAQVVLHHASPAEVHVPPFETVLTRRPDSPAVAARKRTSWLPPVGLAWAATMVLAVGAGWMAHEVLSRSQPSFASESIQYSAPAAPAGADADGTDGAAGSESAPPRENQTGLAELRDEAERGVVGLASERDGTTPRAAEPGAQERPAPSRSAVVRPPATERPPSPELQSKTSETVAVGERRESAGAPPEAQRLRAQSAVSMDMAAAPSPAPMLLVRNANEVLRTDLLTGAPAEGGAVEGMVRLLNDYFAVESAEAWRESTPVDARTALGRDLATIGGMQTASLHQAQVEGRPLVRSQYHLQSGDTVELVQRAEPSAVALEELVLRRDMVAALNTAIPLSGLEQRSNIFRGESVLWLRSPPLTLLLKSAAPLDSLQSLATRIR